MMKDREWLWHDLIEGPGPTQFAQILSQVSNRATIHVYVVASYVHDRESDIQRERDAIVFACNAAGMTAVLANRFPVGVLRGCEAATDFLLLAQRLRQVDAYHWVDLYAGTYVTKGDVNVGPLFTDVLSHFDPWVVEGSRPRGE